MMAGHLKGEDGGHHLLMWARSSCAMGSWRGKGLGLGEDLLDHFQVQLLLMTNFVSYDWGFH